MAQLQVELSDTELDALCQYAAQRAIPVGELVKDYLDYLLAGGQPISLGPSDLPVGDELAALLEHGGAFDWLADEPDRYSLADGEPV